MKKFFLKNILALILLIIISSCAFTPNIEKMKLETINYSLPRINEGQDALIYVVRPSNLGTLVRFNVFVDNKDKSSEVGYNRGNEYIYFFVKPGSHTILSKAENWDFVTIDAKPNDIIFIKQNTSVGFIMARNSLEIIDETEAKYHIKKAQKGTFLKGF
jgi:hypothetical protein